MQFLDLKEPQAQFFYILCNGHCLHFTACMIREQLQY